MNQFRIQHSRFWQCPKCGGIQGQRPDMKQPRVHPGYGNTKRNEALKGRHEFPRVPRASPGLFHITPLGLGKYIFLIPPHFGHCQEFTDLREEPIFCGWRGLEPPEDLAGQVHANNDAPCNAEHDGAARPKKPSRCEILRQDIWMLSDHVNGEPITNGKVNICV